MQASHAGGSSESEVVIGNIADLAVYNDKVMRPLAKSYWDIPPIRFTKEFVDEVTRESEKRSQLKSLLEGFFKLATDEFARLQVIMPGKSQENVYLVNLEPWMQKELTGGQREMTSSSSLAETRKAAREEVQGPAPLPPRERRTVIIEPGKGVDTPAPESRRVRLTTFKREDAKAIQRKPLDMGPQGNPEAVVRLPPIVPPKKAGPR